MTNSALIIVDMQNDFVENGALPVKNGKDIISNINNLIDISKQKRFLILASKDYHPEMHISFAENKDFYHNSTFQKYLDKQKEFWPAHCVVGSEGSEFCWELNSKEIKNIFYKGTDLFFDAYSVFNNDSSLQKHHYKLDNYLKHNNISTLYVCGLTMDFCVLHTCLDAIKYGYKVFLITDATKMYDESKLQETIEIYKKNGIHLITTKEFKNAK